MHDEEAAQEEIRALVQVAFFRRPLAELLHSCTEAALGVIVLKGAALAETVYSRPGLRLFGDIDVLIRSEDAVRAEALLRGLGYVAEPETWADLLQGRVCEANFFRPAPQGMVVVELHTDLLNNAFLRGPVHLDQAGLWARSCLVRLAGAEARVLGPEDQLLHLCLHLAGHYFDAPNSVRDIVQVCAAGPIAWPVFGDLCRAAQARTIGWGGLFAASLQGAQVPVSVLDALAPARHRRWMERLLTARVSERPASGRDARRFLLMWLVLDSAAGRTQALRHLFFPSRAWLRSHYYYDLPHPARARRRLAGVLLSGMHLRFLAGAAWKLGRKSSRRARTWGHPEH